MSALKLWVSSSIVAVALVGGMAMSATAQQSGLVNVNTGSIAEGLAIDLDVEVSQIPITVQAPIGIAANVCNVAAMCSRKPPSEARPSATHRQRRLRSTGSCSDR